MTLVADILLIAGALSAAFYCFVLSRRLSRFTNLESGMGGAVAVLSVQVDELTKALEEAQDSSRRSSESLTELVDRAESAATRLELILASMHDIPADGRTEMSPHARSVRRSRRSAMSHGTEVTQ